VASPPPQPPQKKTPKRAGRPIASRLLATFLHARGFASIADWCRAAGVAPFFVHQHLYNGQSVPASRLDSLAVAARVPRSILVAILAGARDSRERRAAA